MINEWKKKFMLVSIFNQYTHLFVYCNNEWWWWFIWRTKDRKTWKNLDTRTQMSMHAMHTKTIEEIWAIINVQYCRLQSQITSSFQKYIDKFQIQPNTNQPFTIKMRRRKKKQSKQNSTIWNLSYGNFNETF